MKISIRQNISLQIKKSKTITETSGANLEDSLEALIDKLIFILKNPLKLPVIWTKTAKTTLIKLVSIINNDKTGINLQTQDITPNGTSKGGIKNQRRLTCLPYVK